VGQVSTVKTPLTYGQALGALLAAGCPQSALLMVAAQSAVETAAWKSMAGWNFGNVTPSAAQLAAGIEWDTQGVPNMKYTVFPNAVAGAKGMLAWLAPRGLLAAATANDLDTYMALLQSGCYLGCVGNVDPSTGQVITAAAYTNYRAGIVSWMSKLSGVVPVAPPGSGWSLSEKLLAAAALATVTTAALVALSDFVQDRPIFGALRA
jgi:hypothetical protein